MLIQEVRTHQEGLQSILDDFSSSAESVYYVHDLLKAFLAHLDSTLGLRKAELTRLSPPGRDLRLLVLDMHENTRKQISARLSEYECVNRDLWQMTTRVSECLSQVDFTACEVENELALRRKQL